MKVRDIMSRDVDVLGPDATIREAARHMRDRDIGSIPIGKDDRLIGMLTDRDIVIRCIADGCNADTPIREAMTDKVRYCYDDQDVKDVCRNMSDEAIRRLPVVNRDKRLVGIVSLGDVAKRNERAAGEAMEHIAEAPPNSGHGGNGLQAPGAGL
jgi:CBS domain-containing protein